MWLNLRLQLYTFTFPPFGPSHCPKHTAVWPTNSLPASIAPGPCHRASHRENLPLYPGLRWQNIPPRLGMLLHYLIIPTVKSKERVLQFHWPTQWCNSNFDVLGDWRTSATYWGLPSCLLTILSSIPILSRIATRTYQARYNLPACY